MGCGSDSGDSSQTTAKSFRIPLPGGGPPPIRYAKDLKQKPSGLIGSEPKPVFPEGPPPDFVSLIDLIEGIGRIVYEGDTVSVQYVGYDYETHEKFASSWDKGKPFTFTLGKGEVIQGWEEGLQDLEAGDRRELVIPPDEAEGPFPRGIPEDHAVIFVVESVPLKSEGKGKPAAAPKPAKESSQQSKSASKKTKPKVVPPKGPAPKDLVVKDLEEGTGPVAKAGEEVTVQYVGVNYKSGKEFDASWDRGEPFTFELGTNVVIQGWEQGVEGMKVGGRRELVIPPELGYGPAGSPPTIPPNETLVFVVDLLEVK
jgi:peptidylprolyl isomerase